MAKTDFTSKNTKSKSDAGHEMTNVRYGKTDPAQRNLENDFYAILGGNIGPVIPFIVDGELDIWRMVASAVQSDVGPVLLLAGNRFQSASVLFE